MNIDPVRLVASLRLAAQDRSWNPCDEGKALMRTLDAALAVPAADPDQETMRQAMLAAHASDACVLLRGEILAGNMPNDVLTRAERRMGAIVAFPAQCAPEMPKALRLAA
jgi:hypothetical protein